MRTTPHNVSKAGEGPKLSSICKLLRYKVLADQAYAEPTASWAEFCKASGRTPRSKTRMADRKVSH